MITNNFIDDCVLLNWPPVTLKLVRKNGNANITDNKICFSLIPFYYLLTLSTLM